MTINAKRLHAIKSKLYHSYTYRFIDSWISYDEANHIESRKYNKVLKKYFITIRILLKAVDLTCWFILSIVFSLSYLFVNTVFALLHRIIFFKSFNGKPTRLLDYLNHFSESPGVGFMKALEGYQFSQYEIISPSLEIGIETGVISSLHFEGRNIDIGSEYALEHLKESRGMKIWKHKVCFDIRHIPFKDSTFNTLLAVHVMDHFSELDETLREIVRVLKPKGRFIFSLFGHYYLVASPMSLMLSKLGLKKSAEKNGRIRATQRGVFNFYKINEWNNILYKFGMDIVQARYFLGGYISYYWYFIRYYLGRRWGMSGIPNLIGVRYRSVNFVGLNLLRRVLSMFLLKVGTWLYYPFYKKEIGNEIDRGLNLFLVAEKK